MVKPDEKEKCTDIPTTDGGFSPLERKFYYGLFFVGWVVFVLAFGASWFLLFYLAYTGRYIVLALILGVYLPIFFKTRPFPSRNTRVNISVILKAVVSYFNMKLTLDLNEKNELPKYDPKQRYIFCHHPHGIFGYSNLAISTNTLGFRELTGLKEVRFCMADVLTYLPIIREYFIFQGCTTASKSVIQKVLRGGEDIGLIVGGSAEVLLNQRGRERLYLQKRKGFIKLAMEEGAHLVPMYVFGLTDTYYQMDRFNKFLRKVVSVTKVVLPMFYGRFGIFPFDSEVTVVMGHPMKVPHSKNPSRDLVEEVHAAYVKEVQLLFDRNKGRFGFEDRVLEIS